MMSETTEILFNSPALRSLRREQLQKLCKIHSIKANGKNIELIDRLRQHAMTLPKDDPLSIAARSEMDLDDEDMDLDGDASDSQNQNQRPSGQWEVMMESIQEVEENSQGMLSSPRAHGTAHSSDEFGTVNSKPSTAVGSSIRALAASLGLKRTLKSDEPSSSGQSKVIDQTQNDELIQHSIPYSATRAATPPLHDNFTFDPTTAAHTRMSYDADGQPLPGCALRPGEPAPDNARLSMGLGPGRPQSQQQQQPENTTPTKERSQPTTTIRLVASKSSSSSIPDGGTSDFESRRDAFQTPKLKPFATTYDLVMSPSAARSGAFWAPDARPRPFENIYPTLTIDDLPPKVPPSPIKNGGDRTGSGHTGTNASNDKESLGVPSTTTTSSDPFVFGSPLHSVSNTQFRAAATSVLEEMNKRLGISGIEGVGMDIVNKLQPGGHSQAQLARDMKPLPANAGDSVKGGREITKKFDDMHKAEFDKMEGIDGVVKRKMERKKSSSSSATTQVVGKKRKSNVLGELDGKPRSAAGPGSNTNMSAAVSSGSSTRGTTTKGMALPGGFSDEDQEKESGDLEEEGREGKRLRIDDDAVTKEDVMDVDKEYEADVKRDQEREREREREAKAIKRKLEISRAKRRSSVGGAVAAATKSAAARRGSKLPPVTPKSKPSSKFGFLASAAKSLVASVWNRGKTPASKAAGAAAAGSAGGGGGVGAPTKSSLLKQKGGATGFVPLRSSVNPATNTTNATGAGTNTNTTTNAVTATTTAKMGSGATGPAPNQLSVLQSQERSGSGGVKSRSPIPPSANNIQTAPSSMRTGSVTSGSSVGIKSGGTATQVVPTPVLGSGSGSSRTSSLASSRLLAPTTSSLAKMKPSMTPLLGPITNSPRVGNGLGSSKRARSGILSPRGLHELRKTSVFSPRSNTNSNHGGIQSRIFSKPVTMNRGSGIPVLKKAMEENGAEGRENEDVEMSDAAAADSGDDDDGVPKTPATVTRQRTFTRKPRVSRSKVIAKLASQRTALSSFRPVPSSSSATTAMKLSAFPSAPRTKPGSSSHFGATHVPNTPRASAPASSGIRTKRMRSSFAPVRGHVRGGSVDGDGLSGNGGVSAKERDVLASAKKRVRQSEYARRKSAKMSGVPLVGGDD